MCFQNTLNKYLVQCPIILKNQHPCRKTHHRGSPQQQAQVGSKDENNNNTNNSHDLTNVNGFPELVQDLRRLCQDWYASKNSENGNNDPPPAFNVCLLNFYEDGQQRIGWHSDREEIGRTTPIASVSLGAPRKFFVRSQNDGRKDRASLQLTSGSIVVMEPSCHTN